MNALSLLNRRFNNNFDTAFGRSLFNPLWIDETSEADTTSRSYGLSSMAYQTSYDDKTASWKLTLEAAGVAKDNLKVDAKEGHLSITGEKTKGLDIGKFERNFKLPDGIDLEKIEAVFEDGVLTVQMPLEAKKAPKTITIK